MKCEGCHREGDSSNFKMRQVYEIKRIYYICNSCGVANRPTVEELKPKGRWEKRALALARDMRSEMLRSSADIEWTVLVWGPGKTGGNQAVYEKREQVRDSLRRRNIGAYFSEELSLTNDVGTGIPYNIAEVFQSEYCDLVINLADSTGSLMEAEAFTQGLDDRCLLWLRRGITGFPEGLIDSLTSTGRAPVFFDDGDMKSCVVAKASEDWVLSTRTRELEVQILRQRLSKISIKDRRKMQ